MNRVALDSDLSKHRYAKCLSDIYVAVFRGDHGVVIQVLGIDCDALC